MTLILSERVSLTDEGGTLHALIDGQHYAAQDVVPGNGHAWSLVFRDAITARLLDTVSTDELEWCSLFWKGQR